MLIFLSCDLFAENNSEEKDFIELITVARGNGTGTGGHSSLRINDSVYTFNPRTSDDVLILNKKDFRSFLIDYNVFQERDIIAHRIDFPQDKIKAIEEALEYILKTQDSGIYKLRYSFLSHNCVKPVRNFLNTGFPEDEIDDSLLAAIPYFYMKKVEDTFPIIEKRVYRSRRHSQLSEKEDISEYFAPFSDISPYPDSWRFFYTEDLKGIASVFRPVAGATNIISSLLQMVYGIPAALFGKKDFISGFQGVFKSTPELLFIPVEMAEGYSIPDERLFKEGEDDSIFLNYRLPEIDFIVQLTGGDDYVELYQKPRIESTWVEDNDEKESGFKEEIYLEEDISPEIERRVEEGKINDYHFDSLLRILKLKRRTLIFNKHRTLDIDSLKIYRDETGQGSRGRGIKVMVLESVAAAPHGYPSIEFKDFSSSNVRNLMDEEHALYMALLLRRYAPDCEILIASYSDLSDMEDAIEYAISGDVDIILHPEVHPSKGSLLYGYTEEAPVNRLAERAYDAGILWINSAGNFRESFFSDRFKGEGDERRTSFSAKEGQRVRIDFNYGDRSVAEDDEYLIELRGENGEKIKEIKGDTFIYKILRSGTYVVYIKALKFVERYRAHVIKAFANVKLSPCSPNSSSLASPANSKYVVTIGASHREKPVPFSSEDSIISGWNKPELYAPAKHKHPVKRFKKLFSTSAAASYAAAYFAILFGE